MAAQIPQDVADYIEARITERLGQVGELIGRGQQYVDNLDRIQQEVIEKVKSEEQRASDHLILINSLIETVNKTYQEFTAKTNDLDERATAIQQAFESSMQEFTAHAMQQKAETTGVSAANEAKIA